MLCFVVGSLLWSKILQPVNGVVVVCYFENEFFDADIFASLGVHGGGVSAAGADVG